MAGLMHHMNPEQFDPRWEWIQVPEIGNLDQWIRGQCKHLEVEEVHSVDGVLVAALCRTCDTQWTFPYDPLRR
jgi:hypothetical protein